MSKKDYVLIAGAINRRLGTFSNEATDCIYTVQDIANDLARVLAQDNPRFDYSRFIEACGVTETQVDDRISKAV